MNLWTLLPRLFVELFSLVYFRTTLRIKNERFVQVFGYIIAVLFVRDVLYALVQHDHVMALSDILVICVYLIWLRFYTAKRTADIYYFVLNALFILFVSSNIFLDIIRFPRFFIHLWIFVDIVYLFTALTHVTEYNTRDPEMILQTRLIITNALAFINLIVLTFGYKSRIIQSIILPLSYFIHIYMIHTYHNHFVEEEKQRSAFFSSQIDSLFDFLGNLGSSIKDNIDLSKVLNLIVTTVTKNTDADAGAILMVDDFEHVLTVRAVYGNYPPPYPVSDILKEKPSRLTSYFEKAPIKIGETILGEVAKTGKPLFIGDTSEDERMKNNVSDDMLFISSFIAIPLVVSNRVLGVLSTLKRTKNQFFTDTDYFHLKTFSDYAAITINNLFTYSELLEKREVEREVGIAAEIQKKLLPHRLPRLEKAAIAAYTIPAKGISGDYFDIFKLNKDKIALAICDVAGKGIPAGLVMIMIRSILHLIVSVDREAAATLNWINRGITGRIEMDHFATMGFLTYDQKSREGVYSNAAHLPLLIYRSRSGELEQIDTEGLPIGIEKTAQYGQKEFTLEKGDIAILYTDGVIEAMNPEGDQYSFDSLTEVILKSSDLPLGGLVKNIRTDIKQFVGNAKLHDDQTVLLLKCN